MRGLLRKDILMMKDGIGIYLIFIILYSLFSFFSGAPDIAATIVILVMIMLPFNTLSYDELYQWDRYVLTLPVSRRQIIRSKYVFALLVSGAALLFYAAMDLLLGGDVREIMRGCLPTIIGGLVTIALAFPCILKWGQKGRLLIVLFCGVAGGIIGVLGIVTKYGGGLEIAVSEGVMVTESVVLLGALLISLLALLISYKISCKIYEKKQF